MNILFIDIPQKFYKNSVEYLWIFQEKSITIPNENFRYSTEIPFMVHWDSKNIPCNFHGIFMEFSCNIHVISQQNWNIYVISD